MDTLRLAGTDGAMLQYGTCTGNGLLQLTANAQACVWRGRHEGKETALEKTVALDVPIVPADVSKPSEAIGPCDVSEHLGVSCCDAFGERAATNRLWRELLTVRLGRLRVIRARAFARRPSGF